MMERYSFLLAQKGKAIGNITWWWDADEQGRSRLEGDAAAIEHLQVTMRRAVAEKWQGYAPPLRVWVRNPLHHFYEMVLVLDRGGYDVPDALYPYTAQARAEEETHLNDDEDLLFLY